MRIFGWHARCVDERQRNDDRHCADERRGRSTRVEERETALPDDGAEANLTLRPERDRLSEIRMRFVPLGIMSARCEGLAPSLTTFNLLLNYIHYHAVRINTLIGTA